MRWAVASPYFETDGDQWISDAFEHPAHSFTLVPRFGADRNWHQSSGNASFGEWLNRGRQARAAFADPDAGVITVFPQLAAAAAVYKSVRRTNRPLVSWMFNTEGLDSRLKRRLAGTSFGFVDRFVVHSTNEISGYAEQLQLPEDRFDFVPLQYGGQVEIDRPPDQDEPYVFATGSGHRDYGTFFEAVARLGYRTLVLASDRALDGLTVPPNVTILEQISRPEIRRLVRHARVNVVPLNDQGPTAGLITIVETFRHGRSLVITDRPGIDDYCVHDQNALCATLFDPDSMAEAIDQMWSDYESRTALDKNAAEFAELNCTDEVAAGHLYRILDEVSRTKARS